MHPDFSEGQSEAKLSGANMKETMLHLSKADGFNLKGTQGRERKEDRLNIRVFSLRTVLGI